MKRTNFFSKAMILSLTVGMTMFVFAGCGNSAAQTSSNSTQSTTQSTSQNSNKPNAEQRKKKIQDSIQPLVSDGTITQAQSDKIVEALTSNTHKQGSQGSSQNNQQSNQQNSSQQSNNQNNGQNKPRNNPLSKLVSDGVITQAQADAVMKKIGGNFGHKNNGQGSNSNGQSSNNNGQTSTQQ